MKEILGKIAQIITVGIFWIIFIGTLISIPCLAMGWFAKENYKMEQIKNRAAYPAWVKLTGRTDITFEEWLAMKNGGVLKEGK